MRARGPCFPAALLLGALPLLVEGAEVSVRSYAGFCPVVSSLTNKPISPILIRVFSFVLFFFSSCPRVCAVVQLSGLVLCSQAAEVDGRCTAAGTPALFGTRVIVLFDLAETWTLYLAVAVAGAWWVVATWALSLAIAGRAWALEMFWWLRYVAYLLSGLFFVPVTTSLLAWLDSGSRTPQEGTTGELGTVLMWSLAVGVLCPVGRPWCAWLIDGDAFRADLFNSRRDGCNCDADWVRGFGDVCGAIPADGHC